MKSYRQLILDLDGTVYLDGQPIGPVIQQLTELSEKGISTLILTNNTSVSKETYHRKLLQLGLELDLQQIVSPSEVAGKYFRELFSPVPKGFILGTSDLITELESKYGIQHVERGADFVLVGFDKSLTYCKLQHACHLVNKGIPLYSTNIDIACPTRRGPVPDTGALAKLLQDVTGVKPVTHFGKPGRLLAEHLLSLVKDPRLTLLAGDRLYTDICLGEKMGVDTLLVFSGEAKSQDLSAARIQPVYTAATLSEFLQWHFMVR
jgi:4-nitrophenyl phosphatase